MIFESVYNVPASFNGGLQVTPMLPARLSPFASTLVVALRLLVCVTAIQQGERPPEGELQSVVALWGKEGTA